MTDNLQFVFDAGNPRCYTSGSLRMVNLVDFQMTGSLINNPTFSSANLGSIGFNGSNQYIAVNDATNLNPNTESFSVVCWVYGGPSGGADGWVTKRTGASNGYYLGMIGTSTYFITANIGLQRTDTLVANYVPAVWRMCTGVLNKQTGAQSIIINNNEFTGTNTAPTGSHTNSAQLWIGNDSAGNPTSGSIAMALIYSKALTSTEISQIYNATRGRFGI